MEEWGRLDASYEQMYTPVPGVEHKYKDTALLLVNDVCGAYCRYCFRKRLFMDGNDEVVRDVSGGLDYIRAHSEISNVLLTGGDPLIMSTSKLEPIIRQLREIPHVQIIRIGSKMPAFNPFRIINDPSLLKMIETYSTAEKRIYVMAHFNHPRELTDEAEQGLHLLLRSGAIVVNQSPLIRGINDDSGTLANLFARLSFIGVPPYYIFQCRPTEGNKSYSVPIEEAYEIFSRCAEPRIGAGAPGALLDVASHRQDRSGGDDRRAHRVPLSSRRRRRKCRAGNDFRAQPASALAGRLSGGAELRSAAARRVGAAHHSADDLDVR